MVNVPFATVVSNKQCYIDKHFLFSFKCHNCKTTLDMSTVIDCSRAIWALRGLKCSCF